MENRETQETTHKREVRVGIAEAAVEAAVEDANDRAEDSEALASSLIDATMETTRLNEVTQLKEEIMECRSLADEQGEAIAALAEVTVSLSAKVDLLTLQTLPPPPPPPPILIPEPALEAVSPDAPPPPSPSAVPDAREKRRKRWI